MIGTILDERYRIEAELGRGGMGAVYQAYDALLERNVAIKIVTAVGLGTEGRARLMNEARAAARLNHPNIVAVYDAGETTPSEGSGSESPLPFIVMELLVGLTLHEQHPSDIPGIIAITREICDALEHAHSHGIVHRDLKPENVMLDGHGRAKLMDFGLARSATTRLTVEGTIMGTLAYMAPEVALGQEVDGRADLYALGVMLYELTTGQLPFSADDPVSLITQHLYAPVVPPRAKNPEIPPDLERIIVQLMAKERDDRPGTAAEVLAFLERFESLDATVFPAREPSMLDRITRGRLVGRRRELAEARAIWQQAAGGQGQTLLISGEPGIGKSRLAQELSTQAEVGGGQALTGECYAEGGAPYGPFAQILHKVLRPPAGNDLVVPDFVLADLLTLAPELRLYYPDLPPNPTLEAEVQQQRLFENFAALCRLLAERAPLMLVLEDTHWADGGSLALLRHLARQARHQPILLVATYREVELDQSRSFQQVLLDLNRERLATRLKLTRLDRQATNELLAAMFGEEITPDFLEAIYRETEGNPFFVEEVCKALIDRGTLYYQDGRWQRPDMAHMAIPQSIKTAVGFRLERLSQACQDLLTQASVVGREFDFDVLQALSSLGEEQLLDLIDEALAAQLIHERHENGREIYVFEHALIAHTLYDSLNRRRQARMHGQVGLALEQVYADQIESHADQLAYHFYQAARGRGLDKAIHYCALAAQQAADVYAFEEAARYYKQALELLEEEGRTKDILVLWEQLGDVYRQAIERSQVIAAYEQAVTIWEGLPREIANKETGIRLYTKIGEMARVGARHPDINMYIDRGLALAGSQPTIERARLLEALAWSRHFTLPAAKCDFPASLQAAEEAVTIAEALDDPAELSAALDALASVYGWQGNDTMAWRVTQRRLDLLDRLPLQERMDTFHMCGNYLFLLADYAQAEAYDLQTLAIADNLQLASWQVGKLYDLALIYIESGRWDEALDRIHQFVTLAVETGGRYWSTASVLPGIVRLAEALGALQMAPEKAQPIVELASPLIDEDQAKIKIGSGMTALSKVVELFIALERYQEAQALLEPMTPERTAPQIVTMAAVSWAELAAVQKDEAALTLASGLEEKLAKWGNCHYLGRVRRAMGLILIAQGNLSLAEQKLGQALEVFTTINSPWERGRTLAALGKSAQTTGERERAQNLFRQARTFFEAMGALYDAHKTRQLMAGRQEV